MKTTRLFRNGVLAAIAWALITTPFAADVEAASKYTIRVPIYPTRSVGGSAWLTYTDYGAKERLTNIRWSDTRQAVAAVNFKVVCAGETVLSKKYFYHNDQLSVWGPKRKMQTCTVSTQVESQSGYVFPKMSDAVRFANN